jgi:UDP-glucose 4-epimerase
MTRALTARTAQSPPLAIGAAVAGAHGFIGARLSAQLAAAGADVVRFGRADPPVVADGTRVYFHLATSIDPSSAERHPDRVAADRAAFVRLLDDCARLAAPPLVVLASSGPYVYDREAQQPFGETAPLCPRTAYGRAKLALEQELRDRECALPGLVVRLASVYGPTQRAGTGQGVIAHWLAAARAGRPLRLSADLAQRQDLVHVDDVVDALVRIAARAAGQGLPDVMNIGSGRATTLGELLRTLTPVIGGCVAVERVGGRGFERRDAVLDIGRAARCLGWAPRVPLAAGLAQVWQTFGGKI